MSVTQDPLSALQRRSQQRQILAMMGINQWVQPASGTINIADIASASISQVSTAKGSHDLSNAEGQYVPRGDSESIYPESTSQESTNHESTGTIEQPTSDSYTSGFDRMGHEVAALDMHEQAAHEQSPVTYSFDSVAVDQTAEPHRADYPAQSDPTASPYIEDMVRSTTVADAYHQPAKNNNSHDSINNDSLKKVVPFDLQGGRYGDWVILVDIQALSSEGQKLWNNITQALSMTCETTSFPICEGMDTAELANASLAGYVFRIGLREEIKVAALTALPEGLYHPNLETVPTLEEMLADGDAKRQMWEQISQ